MFYFFVQLSMVECMCVCPQMRYNKEQVLITLISNLGEVFPLTLPLDLPKTCRTQAGNVNNLYSTTAETIFCQ